MNKIFTYTVIIVGVLLVLNLIGFNPPISGFTSKLVTNSSQDNVNDTLINYSSPDNEVSDTKGFALWQKLVAVLSLLAGVGIIIGSFSRTPPTDFIVAGLILLFAGALLTDLVWILTQFWSYGSPYNIVGTLILVPLIAGFIVSVYDWWRFGA